MSTWEERMAARAHVRREAERVAQQARWEAEEAAERAAWLVEHEAERAQMLAVGPPCAVCYSPEPVVRQNWDSFHYGSQEWEWQHIAPVDPVVEIERWGGPADDEFSARFEYCTHDCHGADRYCTDSPPIALA
jgi:hypothetical protein